MSFIEIRKILEDNYFVLQDLEEYSSSFKREHIMFIVEFDAISKKVEGIEFFGIKNNKIINYVNDEKTSNLEELDLKIKEYIKNKVKISFEEFYDKKPI